MIKLSLFKKNTSCFTPSEVSKCTAQDTEVAKLLFTIPPYAGVVMSKDFPLKSAAVTVFVLVGAVSHVSPIILTATADFADKNILTSSVGFIYTCHGLNFISPLIGGVIASEVGLDSSYFFYSFTVLEFQGSRNRIALTWHPLQCHATRHRRLSLACTASNQEDQWNSEHPPPLVEKCCRTRGVCAKRSHIVKKIAASGGVLQNKGGLC